MGVLSVVSILQQQELYCRRLVQSLANAAIANQTPELVKQGNSATLLVENSVSGREVKAVNEGESYAAPVSSPEKWSHEAIVARANLRPQRMQKLLRCGEFGAESGIGLFAGILE